LLALDKAREDMKSATMFYAALVGLYLLLRKRQSSDLMQPWVRAYPERII
jgi:hypothetical protein